MKPTSFEISFFVNGTCNQQIELTDDCPYSIDEIVDALNGSKTKNGSQIWTTIQENGELVALQPDGQIVVIGCVVASAVDAEYEEFCLVGP